MTLYPIQDAFVRGEISPRLHARASLDLYRGALSKCVNFLTLPHGGIRKRSGTYFVAETKYADRPTRLIDFRFSEDQAYCLELGDAYCRVHAYGAYLGIEFTTPWPATSLDRLQYVQSADVMWVVHPFHPPHRIVRRGATDWVVELVNFQDGPFDSANIFEGAGAYVSSAVGTTTINSQVPIFTASDVGRLFRIEMTSYTNIKPWEPNGLLAPAGQQVQGLKTRYDGNVYEVVTSGVAPGGTNGWRYGATPPTHLRGVEPDGPIAPDASQEANVGVALAYMHSGFGVARITSVQSQTQVTATVISRFPDEVVGAPNASFLWSFGSFHAGNNPVAVTLFEERLVFASRMSVYASRTGNFDSFRPGEKDDDALVFRLAANEANDIVWLADADGFLTIGTIGGVRALSGSGVDEALTPSSFKNRSSATHRCSTHRPLNTGQAFLYVVNGARAIAEMVLNGSSRFESSDASQISEHIPKVTGGIVASAYQENPDPIAWYAMANGELVGFTYQRDQEVRGLHRHIIGSGLVRSVTVTPGRTGYDDVWVIVERTIAGQQRRYIEVLQPSCEYGSKIDAFGVDSGLTYRGTAVSTVSGLSHLEGQEVSYLADGFAGTGVVSDGSLTLPRPATVIHVGLSYQAEASTLELDVGARDGSLIGRRKRITKVIFSLLETDVSGLRVQSMQRGRWEQAKLPSIAARDGSIDLFTNNIEIPVDDSFEGQARINIQHSGPGPCTLRAVIPAFDNEP